MIIIYRGGIYGAIGSIGDGCRVVGVLVVVVVVVVVVEVDAVVLVITVVVVFGG